MLRFMFEQGQQQVISRTGPIDLPHDFLERECGLAKSLDHLCLVSCG